MSSPTIPQLLVSHWEPTWSLDAQAAVAIAVYLWAVRRLKGKWAVRRTASFLAGIGCIVLALQSGIDAFDDRLLSVHMVQHLLLLMVAPPLLLGGKPVTLLLRALAPAHRRPLVRGLTRAGALTRPIWCLAVFYLAVLLTHLPAFYDATLSRPSLHDGEHALYLVSGLLLWWPMLDGDPVTRHRLSGLGKLVYVIAAMPPMVAVGAYLNRLPALFYPPYGPPAHALGVNAVVDQQQAGAIMWVGGSVLMVAAGLWLALAALVADERRQRAREAHSPAMIETHGGTRPPAMIETRGGTTPPAMIETQGGTTP